jgi:SAM-dependent methyltransferase
MFTETGFPPTTLGSDSFELIYLNSVFSHLPEEMHWALLKEFRRLLVPGGMLIATTWGREFIEYCDSIRKDPKLEEKSAWQKVLAARIFKNQHAALSAYDTENFCFESHDGQGRYGEACIPKGYVQRRWPEILEMCDYIDDRKAYVQNVIVARKRN